ncbi:MAG: prepilin-type N-terminal cleavage/methylation domain-containing protein [Candidatus Omnitrophota bacterium]
MKDYKDQHGFTLIELMLAVMLFSVVSLSVYMVFSQGLRVERRLRGSGIIGKDFYWPQAQIATDLGKMVFYTASNNRSAALVGDQNQLSFVIEGQAGLEEIRYQTADQERVEIHEVRVKNSKDSGKIVVGGKETERPLMILQRRSRPFPFLSGADFKDEIVTAKLLSGGFKILYLHEKEDGRLLWEGSHRNEIIKAVRVDLEIVDEQDNLKRTVRDIFIPVGNPGSGVDNAL